MTTSVSTPRKDPSPPPFTMGRVGRHTLVYGAGILMSKALSFLMLPVYTRYLTPADYGVVGLIEITLDVIAIMGGSQLVAGIYRFYHKADRERRRREVVATALVALGVSYMTVATLAFAAAPLLSRLVFGSGVHTGLVRLAAVSLGFQALLLVPLAYARVRDRSVLFVGVNAAKLVLAALLNVLFIVVLRMGPAGVFASSAITSAVVGTAMTVWLVRRVGMHPTRAAARDLVRYGLPLVATQFATFAATFGDRFFLEKTAGTAEVGIYNLAYQFGFLLAVVGFLPFDQVWGPKRFEIASRPDRDSLLARGFIYANVLLLTTAVGIVLFVEPVLGVMSDPAFHGAAALVPVILIAYVLQSWAKAQDIGILVSERTSFITIANWSAALMALAGYALLVPRFHGWGAAWATVVAFALRYVLTYRFSQAIWPVAYRWEPVLRLLGLAVAVSAAALLLPDMALLPGLAARFALLALYAAALWYLGVVTPGERDRIVGFVVGTWRGARARLFGADASATADQAP